MRKETSLRPVKRWKWFRFALPASASRMVPCSASSAKAWWVMGCFSPAVLTSRCCRMFGLRSAVTPRRRI